MPEASFSDLQNAIAGFNNQVQSYAVQSAVTNASQQVQQLQSSQLDEVEKRNQTQQLSQQLALQLTGLGANASQVQGAMAATAPKSLDTYGDMYAEGLNKNSEPLKQKAKELKKFMNEDKYAMAQLKLQQDSMKMQQKASLQTDQRFSKIVEKQSNLYSNWSNKLADSETKLGMLEEGLLKNDNALIQGASPTLIAKAMGEVGALTEADKLPYEGSKAISERIKQFFETNKTGKLSDSNRALMLKLVKELKKNVSSRKTSNAKLLSSQLSKHATKILGIPLDENEASSYITGVDTQQSPSNGIIPGQSSQSPGGSAPAFDVKQFMTPVQTRPEVNKSNIFLNPSNKL